MTLQLPDFSMTLKVYGSMLLGLSTLTPFSTYANKEPTAPSRFAYVATYNPNGEGVYLMSVYIKTKLSVPPPTQRS